MSAIEESYGFRVRAVTTISQEHITYDGEILVWRRQTGATDPIETRQDIARAQDAYATKPRS